MVKLRRERDEVDRVFGAPVSRPNPDVVVAVIQFALATAGRRLPLGQRGRTGANGGRIRFLVSELVSGEC
jgi:hypothetical protein